MNRADQPRRRASRAAAGAPPTRAGLMVEHAAARQRRDAAALGSDEFRAAAEEVARIEIAIAALEEPAPKMG
jgi:hypothetical protein